MSTDVLRLPRRGCSAAQRCKFGVSWKSLPGVRKKAGAWLGGVKVSQREALRAGMAELREQVSTAALQTGGFALRVCVSA